jgi:hypothetical protein
MYPGSRAAEVYRNMYGSERRIRAVIFLEVLSICHAGGRNMISEANRRRMKKIWVSLVHVLWEFLAR